MYGPLRIPEAGMSNSSPTNFNQGMGGTSAMSAFGPGGGSGATVMSGGGMDVMGSLKKFGDFGAQYANNPMAGGAGGMSGFGPIGAY